MVEMFTQKLEMELKILYLTCKLMDQTLNKSNGNKKMADILDVRIEKWCSNTKGILKG